MLSAFNLYITNLLFSKLVMLQVSKGLLTFILHSLPQSKNQNNLYNALTDPVQTSFVCLTSWLVFSDSPLVWMKCKSPRKTNGPFYCVETLLQAQYIRVHTKDSSVKEFPILLEMRLNNTHINMRISKLLLNYVI